jgi:hypothetical protein
MRANEQILDIRRYGRTSGREVMKSISIKIRKRKSSGCASKVNGLTPGGLHRCLDREEQTEVIARCPDPALCRSPQRT